MSEMMSSVSMFFLYAIAAVFAQNAAFSRALGVSRLVKLVDDSAADSAVFCLCLTLVQLLSAPLAYAANRWLPAGLGWAAAVRPLVLVLCSAAALGLVVLAASALRLPAAGRIAQTLPMATFNCAVLGCMLVTTTQSFTLAQTMGFALGSGLGYTLALLVVLEAQRKLRNRQVPGTFRGLPVNLLYIGILALAIYAFTGHAAAY